MKTPPTKLDLGLCMRVRSALRWAHYFTPAGFAHEHYDAATKQFDKYMDAFIELYSFFYGKTNWVRNIEALPNFPKPDREGVADLSEMELDKLERHLVQVTGDNKDLDNILRDLTSYTRRELGLTRNYL